MDQTRLASCLLVEPYNDLIDLVTDRHLRCRRMESLRILHPQDSSFFCDYLGRHALRRLEVLLQ